VNINKIVWIVFPSTVYWSQKRSSCIFGRWIYYQYSINQYERWKQIFTKQRTSLVWRGNKLCVKLFTEAHKIHYNIISPLLINPLVYVPLWGLHRQIWFNYMYIHFFIFIFCFCLNGVVRLWQNLRQSFSFILSCHLVSFIL